MLRDERIRSLVEEGRTRALVDASPDLDRVLRRYRRRRIHRYLAGVVAALTVAAGIAIPLDLLHSIGRPRQAGAGTELAGFGLSIRTPQGWDGRIFLSPGRGPVVVLSNRPLTSWPLDGARKRTFPLYPIRAGRANPASGELTLALWEFPPQTLQPSDAYPPIPLPVSIRRGDLSTCGNKGCAVRRFALGARHFLLIATLPTQIVVSVPGGVPLSPARFVSDEALESTNAILRTFRAASDGYDLGVACAPAGTRLKLSTASDGTIAFDKPCLAAPANRPFTIDFHNRLVTGGGKQGIPAAIDIFPNETVAYTLVEGGYGSSSRDALFVGERVVSPSEVLYRVPALPPGLYYVDSSGLMSTVLFVG